MAREVGWDSEVKSRRMRLHNRAGCFVVVWPPSEVTSYSILRLLCYNWCTALRVVETSQFIISPPPLQTENDETWKRTCFFALSLRLPCRDSSWQYVAYTVVDVFGLRAAHSLDSISNVHAIPFHTEMMTVMKQHNRSQARSTPTRSSTSGPTPVPPCV